MSGRRRRSNIGRSSVNAKRVRSQRDEESSTEREARLTGIEIGIRFRDRESSVEREARLSQLRDRYRADRERIFSRA
ncbi:hypothetical protein EVAR_18271_1 [Eumeta japonica]|uniref:Uncharacterized protein n=1 Tax=Eumeta variegata TaxID=151549 RepID=A0A4C1UL79_EUMVA|nr:hypothetical protein EVAR_18271_1 [Eumeta japonica]